MRRMVIRSLSAVVLMAALASCSSSVAAVTGGCVPGSATVVDSLGVDGASTPTAAAEGLGNWADGPPLRAPRDGWEVKEDGDRTVVLRSDDVEVTVIRLQDDTWAVEKARCVG